MTRAAPAGTLIPPRIERSLAQKVVQAIVMVGVLCLVGALAWALRFLLLPGVLALLLFYITAPVVDRLENRGVPRSAAVFACVGILVAVIVGIALGTWPSIEAWLQEAPHGETKSAFEITLEQRLAGWQTSLSGTYRQVDWSRLFEKLHAFLQTERRALVEGIPAAALSLLSKTGSVGLALVIAVFLLLDGAAMKKAIVTTVPNRHFENALVMLDRVDRQIAAYLTGTALESLLVTLLLTVPLFLLGMPNALLFAVIFGAANVVPFVGPFIGASAGLLFSLLDPNAPSMGALVIVYVVVHLVDAMLINPWVMGKSLDLHPLTVIVGIFVGSSLGGILGMLAVIPLIAVGKAIIITTAEGISNASTE